MGEDPEGGGGGEDGFEAFGVGGESSGEGAFGDLFGRVAEGGEGEVGDAGRDGFRVGDDGGAELGEEPADLDGVVGDLFVGEGAVFGEV